MGVCSDQLRDRENNCFKLPKPDVTAARYRHSPWWLSEDGLSMSGTGLFLNEAALHEKRCRGDESAGGEGTSVGRLFN